MEPLFDVCLPTHNPNPKLLKEAVDSVMAQTEQRWLLWVRDDGSAENVKAMIGHVLHDDRVRFIGSGRSTGIGASWNMCAGLGSAQYIALMFQDDVWDPQYLERAGEAFEEQPHVGLVALQHRYQIEGNVTTADEYRDLEVWKDANLQPGLQSGPNFLRSWIVKGLRPNIVGEPDFVVLPRAVHEDVGQFREDMPQSLDAEYWVRVLRKYDWYYVAERSGFFRVHEEATTARNRKEGKGLFDRFRILQNLIDTLPPDSDRAMAKKAQIHQFEEMFQKYLQKRERGDRITYGGGGVLKKFALRHPFIVLRALLRQIAASGR